MNQLKKIEQRQAERYLVDTNVISEWMLETPNLRVIGWFDSLDVHQAWTSSISIFEILFGFVGMDDGRKRRGLELRFEAVLNEFFGDRVLSFDQNSAFRSAEFLERRRRMGRPIKANDSHIAAIASLNGCVVVTRNVRDFERLELLILDPWVD